MMVYKGVACIVVCLNGMLLVGSGETFLPCELKQLYKHLSVISFSSTAHMNFCNIIYHHHLFCILMTSNEPDNSNGERNANKCVCLLHSI